MSKRKASEISSSPSSLPSSTSSSPSPTEVFAVMETVTRADYNTGPDDETKLLALFSSARAANAFAMRHFENVEDYEWINCRERNGLLRISTQYRAEGEYDTELWVERRQVRNDEEMTEQEYAKQLQKLQRETEEAKDMKDDGDGDDESEEEEEERE